MTPVPPDTRPLRYGSTLPLDALQPVIGSWNEANSLVFSRLFTIDERGEIVGDLVVDHDVSDGGRRHRLTLRTGVLWHDGVPLTSSDVVFTLRAVTEPVNATRLRDRLEHFAGIEADGDTAIVLRLDRPSPALLMQLTEFPIFPRHRFAGEPIDSPSFAAQPVGSGPYRFVARIGEELHYQAHDAYHAGAPAIGHIIMRYYAEDTDRVSALLAGEIDLAQVKPEFVQPLQEVPDVVVHRFRTGVWRALNFNLSRPHLKDARVRRAISLLIDRRQIVDRVLHGMGQAASGPIPPANWAYPPERGGIELDETAAFSLLEAAGWRRASDGGWWRDGQRLKLRMPYLKHESFRVRTSETIRDQLERVEIPVELVPIGWDYYRRLDAKSFEEDDADAMVVGWGGLADPYDNMSKKFMTGGDQNKQGYSNPELDALFARVAEAGDREQATAVYREILDVIDRDAVMPALVNPDYVFGARRGVTGFEGFVLDNFYEFTRYLYRVRREAAEHESATGQEGAWRA
jgi:peptide/nickel transport system substrate-binding protein